MTEFKPANLCRRYLTALLIAVGGISVQSVTGAEEGVGEYEQFPAFQSPLASKALLVHSTQVGDKVVAVGAYGNVVFSSDGENWQQGKVPTRRLLTTVEFIDEQEGWVAGHDTLILHTTDGGANWEIQYSDPWTGGDIPKPILDLVFTDAKHGYAVGAFSLLLETRDGGVSWTAVDTSVLYDMLVDSGLEPEPNLYAIKPFRQGFLIVGELGTLLYFNPAGDTVEETWEILESPYEGTFFSAEIYANDELFIFGLRGHMFHSRDGGESWSEINTGTIANINAITQLPDGSFIAVGDAGTILRIRRQNGGFVAEGIPYDGFDHILSVHYRGNNELLIFGARGAQIFPFDP